MIAERYDRLASRLSPEAQKLFQRMAELHLQAGDGDRYFMFIRTFGGASLRFYQSSLSSEEVGDTNEGLIRDLQRYGLVDVQRNRQTSTLRVNSKGLEFYRWTIGQLGRPLDQVETMTRRLISGDKFASNHPSAAHHLGQAFELMWTGGTHDTTVSEVGGHLRAALQDTVFDITGDAKKREHPKDALDRHSRTLKGRQKDAVLELVGLADQVAKLDQRLAHVRDETANKYEDPVTFDEMRRACFLTVVACHEISLIN